MLVKLHRVACKPSQQRANLQFGSPESLGVMEPDLLRPVLIGGGTPAGGVALGVIETGGGVGRPDAAFSKSSTCKDAGRLLLLPVRPLIC